MKSISVFVLVLIAISCSSEKKDKSFEQKDQSFYPVAAFVQDELKKVDSLPVAVFFIRNSGSTSDTSVVDKSILHQRASDLITPDITKDPLKEKYKETVFMDETVNTVTMSYDTDESDTEIKKIDVFVDPETEKVKYVYVEKRSLQGDSSILKKMIWTAGKYLQINSTINLKNGTSYNTQEKYSWDFIN